MFEAAQKASFTTALYGIPSPDTGLFGREPVKDGVFVYLGGLQHGRRKVRVIRRVRVALRLHAEAYLKVGIF
jgi:hypothetical protein